ncbi:MAG: hypothetical protein JSY10_25440 [Paenibacillus sp.]|nr:hypothetical protein [Paenibacillus sp.]
MSLSTIYLDVANADVKHINYAFKNVASKKQKGGKKNSNETKKGKVASRNIRLASEAVCNPNHSSTKY